MSGSYRVYVLQNRARQFYIGLTDDLPRRIDQHNSDTSKWTKGKGPWLLRWSSDQMSLGDARRLENSLKRQKGGTGFYLITGLRRS
jgi:predicted GIY-YIG superfamily endonuclease